MRLARVASLTFALVAIAATSASAAPRGGNGGGGADWLSALTSAPSGPQITALPGGGYHVGRVERVVPQLKMYSMVEPWVPEALRPLLKRQAAGGGGAKGKMPGAGGLFTVPMGHAGGAEYGIGMGRPKGERGRSAENRTFDAVVVVYMAKTW